MNPFEYNLAEILMFSPESYYSTIELYNRNLWPAHILAFLLGLMAVGLCYLHRPYQGRILTVILAVAWIWTGYGFLYLNYSTINWYAIGYAFFYFVQVGVLLWFGLYRNKLLVSVAYDMSTITGLFLLIYAVIIHPVISISVNGYWKVELFGLLPTPTLVGTLGILIMTRQVPSWSILIIPLLSAIVGGSTAWELKTYEALAGLIAAIPALVIVIKRHWSGV